MPGTLMLVVRNLLLRGTVLWLLSTTTAPLAAVTHLIPTARPFLPPGKWALTLNTVFLRQMLFASHAHV